MAVAADRNPWISSPAAEPKEFSKFIPDIQPIFNGTTEQAKYGNAVAHQEDGQNVLFLDGHISFEKRAYCGIQGDNIYTFLPQALGFPQQGMTPVPFVAMPGHRNDSLLVHEPAVHRQTITKQVDAIDSAELKQTTVVATLDCPMPEHKNVIWCSTFQIAWNKLKDDIIGEPIKVLGAEELAARLNQAKVSKTDLEEKSFYATAGFVRDGIIEQIQKEMAKRFPSEPVPEFDERYRILPEPIVAYSFLSVDVGFKYPFYVYKSPFTFMDSNGTRTGVTAFCVQIAPHDSDYQKVREQVEILYYKDSDSPEEIEFAVDLCKHTQPYKVVLACVPRRSTLDEAVAEVEKNISGFKHDPDYEVLRKLRPIDILIVPDVLYKLTHHFKELLGKFLGNQKWQGYFFFEAMQMIDFSLSRTGVILKSEAPIGAAVGRRRQIEEPRKLHFDRPFLIYVKKRDGGTSPFFVMWVDNAELMKGFK
jgi:prepilin-type processing-associated H-X9-DG protein